jgi:acyl carrier protein
VTPEEAWKLSEETQDTVLGVIRALLRRKGEVDPDGPIESGADLYEDLRLDSLDLAELSATLEDDLGRDPYTEGLMPRTVGEVLAFYEA